MCCSVIEHYRALHRHPELSGREIWTADYIVNALTRMGYLPIRVGDTGVYADLKIHDALPWLLFRTDMDALEITEETGLVYQSQNPGVMHACGHDAHMAMLLTAAKELRDKELPHNIRFLFQPAEETTQGAFRMILKGAIPSPVKACFAMHVWPGVPGDTVATRSGVMMASSDVFRIMITGKSAHCGQQHLGADALQTAVSFAAELPEIRTLAEDNRVVLFCGSIHSGSSHNVVADQANLWGTLRTYSEDDSTRIKAAMEAGLQMIANRYGTNEQILWEGGCPPVCNDARIVEALSHMVPNLSCEAVPTLAAEDFAFYQQKVPGAMLWLGVGNVPPLHNGKFYVPEQFLQEGVKIWNTIAVHDWVPVLSL